METVYWNPSVVTGKDGKARVTFRAPMALSEYRFSARGVTGSDTLVGQTSAALTVRKDFFVDLKVPAALTQGDKPRFVAVVHHTGVVGTIKVKLSAYAGDRDQVFPKPIEVKADGVDEILFDPFEVPDGETVRLSLSAEAGEKKDEMVVEVPVRPWGVQAFASASGTSSDDATVFVGLPAGRAYENPEMLVVVSPTLRRLLIELAVGRDGFSFDVLASACSFPRPPSTTADRASDLLAATSALAYLRSTRGGSAAPEASRLTDRVRGLVSELTALQGEDGGWPWVGGVRTAPNFAHKSDRMTSARVVWALASAEPLGLLTDPKALDRAAGYLTQEYARVGAGDHETRALVLHALSTRGKANFENANSLNRLRQGLSDAALAYLALTFVNLDRAPLAGEILDILGPRAKTENAAPGDRPRKFWGGAGVSPWSRSTAETTALVALAYAKARPQAAELTAASEWLLAHRQEFGWQPYKAKGPALAALAAYYGKAQAAEDRYDLVVTVNDAEVYRERVAGATEGKAVLVPSTALK
ncbi:MAG TPA: alpha-2-macroglobulin family protein, partial [Isosphaeraceae bacterium]|nr:alpha-2-macroglobulin family protein [Isosphaeraceae bacterium]